MATEVTSYDHLRWRIREGEIYRQDSIVEYAVNNISKGNAWYHGLPHQWWWGMSLADFYEELPNHVLIEKEWIERL